MTKYLLVGLGAVGKSFLKILIEQGFFHEESFFCIDNDSSLLQEFINMGGRASHFQAIEVCKENYRSILDGLNPGDYLFDFACRIKNTEMLQYALDHGIHYLSLSDSNWDPEDPNWTSVHQHYLDYLRIKKHSKKNASTSIVEFGMNPGLVSSFAKKCLECIIEHDSGQYIRRHRHRLKRLLNSGKYANVAKKIGVQYIVETDNDDQSFGIELEPGIVYSTWSPSAFFHEALSAPELMFGTRKQFYQFYEIRDCDFKDYYLSLLKSGIDCTETVFSIQGEVEGSLLSHEEVFSISKFFKHGFYKPTVFFVYSPCEIAEKSVFGNRDHSDPGYRLLDKEQWMKGGESVGIIMQGKRFHTSYFGNYLDSENTKETATVLQVSASAFAAFKYITEHPNEGFLFPEEVNSDEVLNTAKIYLKQYSFRQCPSIIPRYGGCPRKKRRNKKRRNK